MLRNGAWAVKLAVWPIAMFIVLAIFGTGVVYWVYARAQQLIDVSMLAILLCTIPVFAVAFAYFLLREPVHCATGWRRSCHSCRDYSDRHREDRKCRKSGSSECHIIG